MRAQDETPTKITDQNRSGDLLFSGTVGTDLEHVVIAGGNLVVNIPILSVPGRAGMPFKFGIWYDNRFWTAAERTGAGVNYQFWNMEKRSYLAPQTGLHGVWSATQHGLVSTFYQKDCGPRITGPSGSVMGVGSVIYIDSAGGKHSMEVGHEDGSCDDPAGSWSFSNTGPDTTGIGASGSETSTTLADGTLLTGGGLPVSPNDPPTCSGSCPVTTANAISTEMDSNGNMQGEFPGGLDTLKRSVLTQVQGTNSVQYKYKDSNGTDQVYTVNFQQITLNTAFNVIGSMGKTIAEGGATRQLETSLTLPNGHSYTFTYDNYGSLTSLGLPTGGTISYTWQNFPCGDTTYRYVSSRQVIANGQTSTWTFSQALSPGATCSAFGSPTCAFQVSSSCTPPITVTVTDPLGNQSIYTVMEGNVTSAKIYQGTAAAGTLLRQYTITYTDLNYPNSPPALWLPTKMATQLENGLVSEKDFQYDTLQYQFTECPDPTNCATFGPTTFTKTTSRGNVTDIWEYDWGTPGSGTHGPLLRHTHKDYLHDAKPAYAAANIVSKVLDSVVYDGAGNKAAETDYEFDGSTPSATSGAPQHNYTNFSTANNVRGNATKVKHWRNTDGAFLATSLTYDDLGNIRSVQDPLGNKTSYLYTDSFANTTCAPPANSQAWVSQVTNPLSQNIQVVRYPCTGLVQAHKDQNDINAGSAGTTYTYDLMGRPTVKSLVDGGQVSTTYNDVPQVSQTTTTKITSTLSLVASTIQDGLGRAIQSQVTSDPAGTDVADTTYDALGRKATVSNPYRTKSDSTYGVTKNQYDALNRVTQTTKQDGSVSNVSYNGNCTTMTDEAGKQRRSCSDALARLIEVDEPGDNFAGVTSAGSLSISGALRSAGAATSASGTVTISGSEQTYTDMSNCIVDINGLETCATAWDVGSITVIVNGSQKTSSFGQGSTSASIAADLAGQFNADGTSQVTASVSGSVITLTTKAAGAATNYPLSWTSSSQAGSFSVSFSGANLTGGTNGGAIVYDAGNVQVSVGTFSASVPYGQSTNSTPSGVASALANALNASGSPVTAGVSGSAITINYKVPGSAGNVAVSSTSSTTQTAYFSGGSFCSPSCTTTLAGGLNPEGPSLDHNFYVTQYAYDALGNLLNVTQKGDPAVNTSAQWRVRNFTYNSLSQLLTATNPESGTISYSYDLDGNVLQKTSPAANQTGSATQTMSYCYDAVNRMTGKAHTAQACPLTTPVVNYSYDAGTNGIGHMTSLTDQAGSGRYTYDTVGRIATETRAVAGVTNNLSYSYNLAGAVTSVTYPGPNFKVSYTYDAAGRATSVSDSNNFAYASTRVADFLPTGALSQFETPNFNYQFTYNNRLQPTEISAGNSSITLLNKKYNYNYGVADNGNVMGITNVKDNARSQSFTYDPLNRLASAKDQSHWGNTYTYDAWGNLLGKTVMAGSPAGENLAMAVDAGNHATATGYGYDAAGNMKDNAGTVSYDPENRLTGFGGYSYAYDAEGTRVEKTNGTVTTRYWDGAMGVLAESDTSGNFTNYIFWNGQRLARNVNGDIKYYVTDPLHSTNMLVDKAGTATSILDDQDFYPWGGTVPGVGVSSSTNHYLFTGHERDGESSLDYFGARYYSNALGRFVTPDWAAKAVAVPYADLNDPQSLNLYSYVRNRPTVMTDADGHTSDDSCNKRSDCFVTKDDKNETATLTKTQTETKVTTDPKTGDQISTTTRTTSTITVSTSDKNNGQVLGGTTQTTTTTANLSDLSKGTSTDVGDKTSLSPLQAVQAIGESKLISGLQESVAPSMMHRLSDHKVGVSGVAVGAAGGACAILEPCGAAVGTAVLVGSGLYAAGAAIYDFATH